MRKKLVDNKFELMEGFRHGLESSFTELFNQLYPSLSFYGLRITNDQEASEEIAEEAFLKVWNSRDLFYHYNHLKAYLYKVVKNSSLKWLKREKNIRANSVQITEDYESSDRHALDSLIQSEVFLEIESILGSLPSQSKKIAKLIFFEDKNIAQVAKELGLSISTVKTQKGRALAKLKKYLLHTFIFLSFWSNQMVI